MADGSVAEAPTARQAKRWEFLREAFAVGRADPPDPRETFEAYILPHLDTLYRAAVRLSGQVTDAEDLVQETCLKAFTAIGQLRDVSGAKPWLFKILRTTYLRRWGEDPYRRHVLNVRDMESALADFREILYDRYENNSAYARLVGTEIRAAIAALPLPYREAVVLADVAKFSYREVGRILEVPLGTVMSRLYRGRRMLRATLRDYARPDAPRQREP